MFTREDVLLDSQASVNVFCNADLITNIKLADKDITLQGVDAGAKGINICKEGEFRSLGKVYYSTKTAANILSYAVMVDSGNQISYHQPSDSFTLTSKGDKETFVFRRKNVAGSGGRFYCCDMGDRENDRALVETVDENMTAYSKRDVSSAAKAREMLSKMGFPPVSEAIAITNIKLADKDITLQGVDAGAKGINICEEGEFRSLGKVYYSTKTAANILSYAVMVDSGNDISYHQPSGSFTLTSKGDKETFVFRRKNVAGSGGRFYCCDMGDRENDRVLVETVAENLRVYTKREISGAAKARDVLGKMGYPPIIEAISIIGNGRNFRRYMGCRHSVLERKDGQECDASVIAQVEQTLSVDVMFIEGVPSLVGVASPLDLTLAVSLTSLDTSRASRSASVIKKGIVDMIATLRSRNFFVTLIMTDGEGAIGAVATELRQMGIELDVSGTGGHVSRIERRIRVIKERVRAHVSHKLPYNLTTLGIAMLLLFCVSRLNFQVSHSRIGGASPRELFSGRRVDGALDFRAGYGFYAQCTVANTDNSMAARTEDCVVVVPTGNRTGTVKMLSIATGRIVSRDQFKILPMPDSAIAILNELARREGRGGSLPQPNEAADEILPKQSPSFAVTPTGETEYPIVRMNDEIRIDDVSPEPMSNTDNSEDAVQNGEEVGVTEESRADEEQPTEHTTEPVQLERRTLFDMFRDGRNHLTLTTSAVDSIEEEIGGDNRERIMNISVREALKTRGAAAEIAILKELSQMVDKKVWRPVHTSSLSGTDRSMIIRSQMFLKERFLPTGQFEKLKARLVAGRDQQDKTLYEDLSSPTVSSSVVMTLLSVAAHEKMSVTVVDITGAYLNAEMGREVTVHMRLDRVISELITRLQPEYAEYLDHRGSIVVRLQRALYGCVESAALWHEHLSVTLVEIGYERNKHECCVFNKTNEDGTQCTVAFHVDDLLITSESKSMIESLRTGLSSKYGTVSRTDGPLTT